MKYTKRLFLAVFMLACLTPVVASAMGERPNPNPQTAYMCDTSSKTIKFVLTSKNGEIKETFKLPVRYMSAEFERNGRLNSSLHLDAVLGTLEPRCYTNGEVASKEESFTIELHPNLRSEESRNKLREEEYRSDEFEQIELSEYPDFLFKVSKDRPKHVRGPVRPGGYIPAYPKSERSIPADAFTLCEAIGLDIKSLNMCKMHFLYQHNIAAVVTFDARRLKDLEGIYSSSIALIKKFHVPSSMEDVAFSPDNYDDIADAMRYLVKKLPLGMQKESAEAFLVNKSGGTAFEMYPNTTSYHFGRTKKHLLSINKNKCKGDWKFEISYDQDQKIQKVRFPCF